MLDISFRKKILFLGILLLFVFFPASSIFASDTNGTIDGTSKYAWGENIGWINFGCDNCNTHITDSGLSGNAWSTQFGWINLNPDTSGVKNDGEGTLSGFAWSSNLGWINFTGVTINSSGEFSGFATLKSDSSRISFNCSTNGGSCALSAFKVKTDWRPISVRPHGGGGGGGVICVAPQILINGVCVSPTSSSLPSVSSPGPVAGLLNNFSDLFLNFFKPKQEPLKTIVQVPQIAPLSFKLRWNLLPVNAIREFVFAPLPYEVRILASKFPELDQTLKSVGIKRLTDMSKLTGVTLNLPGLSELTNTLKNVGAGRLAGVNKLNNINLNIPGLSNINQKMPTNLGVGMGTGKISLIKGLPLSKFSLVEKKNLPAEFIFARADGELVDLNVAMSVSAKGDVMQKISSLPGKTLRLVVKPISKARSVTGYFVFKSSTPKVMAETEISRASLTASALFSMNGLVEKTLAPAVPVENKLVLSSFEYTDPDHDGIYTADVVSPAVPGEYEVVTVIDYIDPVLGTRQMRMITVIDPEGYVFEKNNGKETRIPSAVVSLYYLNSTTKKYELWPGQNYQQENPQVTDIRGTYSFLVPEGSYYFQVEAPGYNAYQGKAFMVIEGSGIHQNIELKSGFGFFSDFDWKTALLIVVLLLVYNLSRDRLSKFFKHDGK